MKKQREKMACEVASVNEIWEHKTSGEKFLVIKVNKKTIALLSRDQPYITDPITGRKNWINETAQALTRDYQLIQKMVTA